MSIAVIVMAVMVVFLWLTVATSDVEGSANREIEVQCRAIAKETRNGGVEKCLNAPRRKIQDVGRGSGTKFDITALWFWGTVLQHLLSLES